LVYYVTELEDTMVCASEV